MVMDSLKSRFPAVLGGLLLLSLAACASQPAPYAPKTGDSATGYTDQQLAANRYRVTFTGNSVTDRVTVEDYLLLRAAEVTLGAGYSDFLFDTRDTKAKTTYYSTFSGWPGWGGYGWYWHSWPYNPYGPSEMDDMTSRPQTRYFAYAEIVLLTPEQAKTEPRSLNARDVIAHLRPVAHPEQPPGPPTPPSGA